MKKLNQQSSKSTTEFFKRLSELAALSDSERLELLKELIKNESCHSRQNKYLTNSSLRSLIFHLSDYLPKGTDLGFEANRMLDYTTRAELGILVNLTDETAKIISTRSRSLAIPGFIIFNLEDKDNVDLILNLFSNDLDLNLFSNDLDLNLFSNDLNKKDDRVSDYYALTTMVNKMELIQTLDSKSKVRELKELLYRSELHFKNSFSSSNLKTMYSITKKATNNPIYKSSFDSFSDYLTICIDALAFYSSEVNQLKSKDVSIFDILWLKREQKRLKEHGFLSMKSRFSTSVIKEGLGYVIS